MAAPLFGVETEYAFVCEPQPEGDCTEGHLMGLMERAAGRLVQLPCLHSACSSYMLANGGKLYVDAGAHVEMSSPECTDPWQAVAYVEAGHRILAGLLAAEAAERPEGPELGLFRNNVDYAGQTWGTHESYLFEGITLEELQPALLPHLVTRIVYTGAGGFNLAPGLEFTLSPRVAHLKRVASRSSTDGRGIWHEKYEPLAARYGRLHLLCGESNCSQTALWLKVGTTALVVALAAARVLRTEQVQLADPLRAIRAVAADSRFLVPLSMADRRRHLKAVEIQRLYLELAEQHRRAAFMPAWAGDVCQRWRQALAAIELRAATLETTFDYGIKRALFARHAQRLGIHWDALPLWNRMIDKFRRTLAQSDDPLPLEAALAPGGPLAGAMAACEPLLRRRGLDWGELRRLLRCRDEFYELDWRYGQVGARPGLFDQMDAAGVLTHRVAGADAERAMTEPPTGSRAQLRGNAVRRLAGKGGACAGWECVVDHGAKQYLHLSDPFASQEQWLPLAPSAVTPPAEITHYFQTEPPAGRSRLAAQFQRRGDALEAYVNGDYQGALRLLRGLAEEGFEMPSTYCHLARALLLDGSEAEAREQVDRAWEAHDAGTPSYVIGRILFYRVLFAMLDGDDPAPWIARLRALLGQRFVSNDWTIGPVVSYAGRRLDGARHRFLAALAAALSNAEEIARLNDFPLWRTAAPVAWDAPAGLRPRATARTESDELGQFDIPF